MIVTAYQKVKEIVISYDNIRWRNVRIILIIELHNYLLMFFTKSRDNSFNFIKIIIDLMYFCFSCSNSSIKNSNAQK
jgi:hypothetical protein